MTTTRIRARRLLTSDGPRWYLDPTRWVDLPGEDAGPVATTGAWRDEAADDLDDEVLSLFERLGLATRTATGGPLAHVRVGLVGTGLLARAVARDLLRAGVPALFVHDPTVASSIARPGPRAQALVRGLRPRHRVVVQAAARLDDLVGLGTDVVVVATGTAEPDRVVLDALVRLDLGHLVASCGPESGSIGPLVLPGRTPCSTCADLAATAGDPSWPQVLAQLCATPERPNPVLVAHVASRVALELGWVAGDLGHAGRLDGRKVLVDLASPVSHEVRFTAAPDCPCGLADRAA